MPSLIARYKDGKKLSAEANANIKITRDRQRQESYSMTLNMCKYQDTGEYECRVTNDQGTTSTKCNVVVNGECPARPRPGRVASLLFASNGNAPFCSRVFTRAVRAVVLQFRFVRHLH